MVEDLILAVDVSTSMRNKDFQPSRIDAVKIALKSFVQDKLKKYPSSRIGIVVFYGFSVPVIDLVNNVKVLVKAIDSIRVLGGGTALGDGIIEAYRMLRDQSRDGSEKRVLVVTDGTFNTGIEPVFAVLPLRNNYIKIDFFTFGRLYPSDINLIKEILKMIKGRFLHVKRGDLYGKFKELLE